MRDTRPILEARGLTKTYRDAGRDQALQAVQDVSLQVYPGETFGVVGESGCGKSTLARLLMCLEKPTAGEIFFQGQRVDSMPEGERRKLRPRFQMVFQDSGSSLNPRKRVEDLLREPMEYHRTGDPGRVAELLSMVGLPGDMAGRYPHELSGGQRQRVCIARALSLKPQLVVLDEPVSALDVSVQAQILNLLRQLQERLGLTYVFIGHGLGAVHYISHRIAVMYQGRIVEDGPSEALFDHPAHPYTRALLDAAPVAQADARLRKRAALKGEVERQAPRGACPLYPRCPRAEKACLTFSGKRVEIAPGRGAVCTRAWEE